MALTTLVTVIFFVRLGLYRAVLRFAGTQMLTTVFIGVSFSVLALAFFGFLLNANIPRSVPFIYLGLAIITIGGTRFTIRSILTIDQRRANIDRVIIYGAGSAGIQLASALALGKEYKPVAYVDDDKKKQGTIQQDLRVYKPRHIPRLINRTGASIVLLAMSNTTPSTRARIIQSLSEFEIRVQTIPGFADIVNGDARIEEIRDIEIEDLLGRDSIPPDENLLDQCIQGKSVMVTGAGGSIGSELCRQVIARSPITLILYELSEYALYAIEQELESTNSETKVIAILGNVQDEDLLRELMYSYKVETVYHAAAYKHVPIVEHNIIMGLKNNVFGSRAAASAANSAGVRNFILISTDKAVRPTNFMGATKRFAELILQDFAVNQKSKTTFSMVRFGNVLGSSGSVVPLFRKQILQGGPVTVTHPEITRYFMTIPEAVQLVIQSSALSQGGEVFVLDMGRSVQIKNLAKTMIRLMGKSLRTSEDPDGEIEIEYSGLRPGEKLYEELLIGNNCVRTSHPKITRATESQLEASTLKSLYEEIVSACGSRNHQRIMELVKLAVPEYLNEPKIHDHMYLESKISNLKPTS
jgi:FlaA1/EpsC-like NDP-sugar epimerase